MPAGVACPPAAWRPPARAGAGPWAQQCNETKDSPHGTTLVPRDYPIHRHCFTGGWRETQQWLDAFPNLCLGLAPLVAFEHVSGDPLIEAARNIPLTRLLLGTDSPYFLPKWLVPRDYPIHRHCFTGGWRETQQWLDAFPNLCLGLAPLVAFEHVSGDPLIEAARNIPLARLLLGTDSPYFLPKWLVPGDYPIHRHCFTGGWRETQQWLDAFPNLCLGLAPLVAFEHVSGDPLIEAARNIPLARLLLGTDSPYFLPKWTSVAAVRGMQAGVETQGPIIWSTGAQGVLLLAVLPQRGFSPQFLVGFLEAELGAPTEPTGIHHFLPTGTRAPLSAATPGPPHQPAFTSGKGCLR
ncbi:uncharacterized protein LOC144155911 [Haemaphysalis longicornis]